MKEPRPGRNPTMTRFASPSGKYGFQMGKISLAVVQNLEITCGPPPPPPPPKHTQKKHPPPQALPPTMPRCHQGGALHAGSEYFLSLLALMAKCSIC